MKKTLKDMLVNPCLLQSCFDDLKKSRKDSHHNNDIWHLSLNWEKELPLIIEQLSNGTYKLEPAQKYYIKDINQPVTVWTSRDTVVLNALKIILESRIKKVSNFERVTHLKGNGGVKGSVKQVSNFMKKGSYVFKTDIADYYSSIDHNVLLDKVRKFTNDELIIDLIKQYVNIACISNGEYSKEEDKGMPRGNGLSHVISAIYLHDIDKLVSKFGAKYIRYADDIIVVTDKRHQLRKIKKLIYRECTKLKLCLSLPKTITTRVKEGIEYLGYFISASVLDVAKNTIQRMKDKVLQLKEQHASDKRVEEYQSNWRKWAIGGVCLYSRVKLDPRHKKINSKL